MRLQSESFRVAGDPKKLRVRLAFHAVPSPAEFHLPFVPRNRAIGELVTAGVTALAEAELARYLDDSEQIVLAAMAEQQPRP